MKNYQFVSLVFLFLFHITGISQIEVPFYVKTANYHTKKYESGISVKAYQDDKIVRNLSSDNKGDVVLYLPIGAKYRIEISKQGKITRFVNVDYSKLKDTIKEEDADPRGEVEMSLFDDLPGIDYSFVLDNPATNFTYDPNIGVFFDEQLAQKTIKEVDRLLNVIQKAKIENQRLAEEKIQLSKEQEVAYEAKIRTDEIIARAEAEALNRSKLESSQKNIEPKVKNEVADKKADSVAVIRQAELNKKAEDRKADSISDVKQAEIAKIEEIARKKIQAELARKKAEADSLAAIRQAEINLKKSLADSLSALRQAQELEARKKAEADSLAEVARKKAEADSLAEVARKKEEADSLAEVARKKAEADSIAELARKKAEADSIAELARKKAEADSLAEVARKKAEADSLAEVSRKKAEADSLAEVARKKAEADSIAEVARKKAEADSLAEVARKKAEADSLASLRKAQELEARKKAEADSLAEVARKKEEILTKQNQEQLKLKNEAELKKLIESGDKSYNSKLIVDAKKQYEQALKISPDNVYIKKQLLLIQQIQDQSKNLKQVITKPVESASDDFIVPKEKEKDLRYLKIAHLIYDVEHKKTRYSKQISQEIASYYPEGMAIEAISGKDKDGIICEIDRRVLVINGFADIYSKFKSTSGVYYLKNGLPSSDYIWEKETSKFVK